jgi:hypothetical protein
VEIHEDGRTWDILGIQQGENGLPAARVRMLVKGEHVDEDFALPVLGRGISRTLEVYQAMLASTIEARIAKLNGA